MMHNQNIHDAMSCLDPRLIQEAATPDVRRKPRLRPVVLAACLILLIVLPVMAVTGNLLVEHYFGDSIPAHLAEQELDAFFRATTVEKVPVSTLSQEALDAAAAQSERTGYYGFDTWEDAEAFLGLNILDSEQIGSETAVPMMDETGRTVLCAPCHLTLHNSADGVLYAIALNYFFQTTDGISVSLNANAVTDQNPNDNHASLGVSDDSSEILHQSSEQYLTKSGLQSTMISSQYSGSHGWSVDGWTQKNGFVLRLSLSVDQKETGTQIIRDLLDSIQ